METLMFDLSKEGKKFKLLNATNGGPLHKRYATEMTRSTMKYYKAARIPYSRNHDCGIFGPYGGPYSHDVSKIFRDFNADPYDPDSYDFACTDEDILVTMDAGTEVFYRLGETIEHQIKKHATIPPADFHKWAVICEHIIRHYNEGWADGFHHNIQYWEIWNEADLIDDDALPRDKTTWGGTKLQFFEMYEIVAKHLKSCFPNLKIGGPALGYRVDWADEFLERMRRSGVEIDFFSWHNYRSEPFLIMEKAERIQKTMEKHGYGEAENICNEWNYMRDWSNGFPDAVKIIHGIKGAIFALSVICAAQNSPIDMLMYYSTIPHVWNGAFDYYTTEPLKGYYPLYWYGKFYDMEKEIKSENNIENIYSLCGVGKDGKVLSVISYYSDDDTQPNKSISIDFGKQGNYEIYLLDENHDAELVDTTDKLEFDMKLHSAVLIKEI